jgi:hypothetical protein
MAKKTKISELSIIIESSEKNALSYLLNRD